MALLCCSHASSAQNISTSFLLPDILFWGYPESQAFVGETAVTGSKTYYTVNCGANDTNFWPGPYGCAPNNSYTFFADSKNTQFLIRSVNLGQYPLPNTAPIATWLEAFNQTITINCGPLSPQAQYCETSSLYNNEDYDDKSIISSTIVTQTATVLETSLYPVVFTAAAAATAAATPSNALASSTNPATPTPTASSGASESTPTAQHAGLSSGAKAGIGIGVAVGVFALAGIALALYRHRKRKDQPRPSQMENLVPPGGGEFEEGKSHAPDNGGVYEMEGRHSPMRSPELEA
ncbi:MAG: hypothetical protein ALECFALPRED_010205 [Alectoria fallacina]|uniref:Uncharacterized protein n=1 Tax=Alectoria fallacina TaxID=1903189 RepID=A0A8H3J965_9LECA|nr:MAG: hypothetical protein ALECFALPRED_010205 [Alectoria fallacina]